MMTRQARPSAVIMGFDTHMILEAVPAPHSNRSDGHQGINWAPRHYAEALEQEARDLKAAIDEYASSTPAPRCPHQAGLACARQAGSRVRKAQRQLLASGEQQARLMLVNAYDHLVSMGRLLGSDGAMSLYAHTSVSRSVCEAAVRHAWLLDPRSATTSGSHAARHAVRQRRQPAQGR
jgi:hypothetical protein